MFNVLMPLGGKSTMFANRNYKYPKHLIEIDSKPMIEHVIGNISQINPGLTYTFVINKEDNERFHLGNVLKLLTNGSCHNVVLQGETKGAACSALMAVEHISEEEELIICNGDQLIDIDLKLVIKYFQDNNADAGVINFEAVHPRWAFAIIEDNIVYETAEKKPISNKALAGFYYFRKGKYFLEAAKETIIKGADYEGMYYIAPSLNEMILKQKKVIAYEISSEDYYTFNTPEKVESYRKK